MHVIMNVRSTARSCCSGLLAGVVMKFTLGKAQGYHAVTSTLLVCLSLHWQPCRSVQTYVYYVLCTLESVNTNNCEHA